MKNKQLEFEFEILNKRVTILFIIVILLTAALFIEVVSNYSFHKSVIEVETTQIELNNKFLDIQWMNLEIDNNLNSAVSNLLTMIKTHMEIKC